MLVQILKPNAWAYYECYTATTQSSLAGVAHMVRAFEFDCLPWQRPCEIRADNPTYA